MSRKKNEFMIRALETRLRNAQDVSEMMEIKKEIERVRYNLPTYEFLKSIADAKITKH